MNLYEVTLSVAFIEEAASEEEAVASAKVLLPSYVDYTGITVRKLGKK